MCITCCCMFVVIVCMRMPTTVVMCYIYVKMCENLPRKRPVDNWHAAFENCKTKITILQLFQTVISFKLLFLVYD